MTTADARRVGASPPVRAPRRLRPGDTVAVVAPCGPVDPERLARGVRVLTDLGLRVVTAPGVLRRPATSPDRTPSAPGT